MGEETNSNGSAGNVISASSTAGEVTGVEPDDVVSDDDTAAVVSKLSLEPLLLVSEPVLVLLLRVRLRFLRCASGAFVTADNWKPSFCARWKAFRVALKEVGKRGPGDNLQGLSRGVVGAHAPWTHGLLTKSLILSRSLGSTVSKPEKLQKRVG